MSVQNIPRRAGPYTGTGSTTAFPFEFKVFTEDDVEVRRSVNDNEEETLVAGTDYTVELNSDQDAYPGGTVTLAAPLAQDVRLTVLSAITPDQQIVLTNHDGFLPETLNEGFDKAIALIQELKEEGERTLKVPSTSEKTPEELTAEILDTAAKANEYAEQAKQTLDATNELAKQVTEATETATGAAESAAASAESARADAEQVAADKEEALGILDEAKTTGQEAIESAEKAIAAAAEAAQSAKEAGYSFRYCELLEANSEMDIAFLYPSKNAKVGDHVVNAQGAVFEIETMNDLTFTVGFQITSLKGPQGPMGDGLELSDAFNSLEELLAQIPTGYPGQTVLVGNQIYTWSESLNQWVASGDLTVSSKPLDTIPWDQVTDKPPLVSYDEVSDEDGFRLEIAGMTYVVI